MKNHTPLIIIGVIIGGIAAVFLSAPVVLRHAGSQLIRDAFPVFVAGAMIGGVAGFFVSNLLNVFQTHGRQVGAGIILFCIIAAGFLNSHNAINTGDAIGFFILGGFGGAILGVIINAVLDGLLGLLSALIGR